MGFFYYAARIAPLVLVGFVLLPAQTPESGGIQAGFEQRVRSENWNNICDYSDRADDQRNQIRMRTRLWAGVPLTSNVSVLAGLVSETNKRIGTDLVADEVLFEALYVDVKRVFTPKLSLRAGRQDLIRGEGFILSDGTPADGSRSAYVNAADLTLHAWGATLEFLAIVDPGRERFLPRVRDQHRTLTEWDDKAAGIYWTKPAGELAQVEGYYFYKTETNDPRAVMNRLFQPDRYFHTWGGRLSGKLRGHWGYAGEWAWQSGRQSTGAGIAAWGGYLNAKRTFDVKGRPYVLAGYTAMSGDDPATPRQESWDPLFARGAKWGDLLLYSMIPEKGPGYLTNVRMPQVEAGFTPWKHLNVRTTYYRARSFHPLPGDWRFATGTHRGGLFQLRGDINLNQNWRGHVVYEGFSPGDFYSDRRKGYFLRFEISFLVRMKTGQI